MAKKKMTEEEIAEQQQNALALQEKMQAAMQQSNEASNNAAAETAKAMIHAAYTLAMHSPRDIRTAELNIARDCSNYSFAKKAKYSLKFGSTRISGPTIRLMELIKREYRNLHTTSRVTYDGPYSMRMEITMTDLESNNTESSEIAFTKTVERKSDSGRTVISSRTASAWNDYTKTNEEYTLFTVLATEQELNGKREALVSKAIRKLTERLVPNYIVENAMEVVDATIAQEIKNNPNAAREDVIKRMFNMGIQPLEVEAFLQHPIDQCQESEISFLIQICNAIEDGIARWVDFATTDEPGTTAQQKAHDILGDIQRKEKEKAISHVLTIFVNAGWTEAAAREFTEARFNKSLREFSISDLRGCYTWAHNNIGSFERGNDNGESGSENTESGTDEFGQ